MPISVRTICIMESNGGRASLEISPAAQMRLSMPSLYVDERLVDRRVVSMQFDDDDELFNARLTAPEGHLPSGVPAQPISGLPDISYAVLPRQLCTYCSFRSTRRA